MKSVARHLTAFLAVVLFAGCATASRSFRPSKFALLNLGMTKDEVLRLLGQPEQAGTANEGVEVFRYAETWRGAAGTNFYGVLFRNGQVIEYGAEVGIRLGGQYSIREVFTDSWQPSHNSYLNSTQP